MSSVPRLRRGGFGTDRRICFDIGRYRNRPLLLEQCEPIGECVFDGCIGVAPQGEPEWCRVGVDRCNDCPSHLLRISLIGDLPGRGGTPEFAYRRVAVNGQGLRGDQARTAKVGSRHPRFDESEFNSERFDFLSD